jgi:hypothetical protein
MVVANTLAYCDIATITAVKSFLLLTLRSTVAPPLILRSRERDIIKSIVLANHNNILKQGSLTEGEVSVC